MLLVTVCCFFTPQPSYAAVTAIPELVAESAVLINADTGEILYDKYKDFPRFPASTTKIMTALLALENLQLDQVVTISHNASYTEGSRIYLLEGEQVTVEQLLYALMLPSANDAAIALAEACAGDVESFAVMMNERAKQLGAQNTNFVTPNGLPDEAHVVSAYDMALIAREAMKNEVFRQIVATYEYIIPPTALQEEERKMHNTNRLLFDTTHTVTDISGNIRTVRYEGTIGIKTGYTNTARSCLVAAAEKNGMTLLGVVYKSEPDALYADMIKLLDFGFDNFDPVDLGIEAGAVVGEVRVRGGKERKVDVTVKQNVRATVERMSDVSAKDTAAEYTCEIESDDVTAPVETGQEVGTLVVTKGSQLVGTFPVYAAEAVEESSMAGIRERLGSPLKILAVAVAVLLIVAALTYVGEAGKYRRKEEQAAAERKKEREKRRSQRQSEPDDLAEKYKRENSWHVTEIRRPLKTAGVSGSSSAAEPSGVRESVPAPKASGTSGVRESVPASKASDTSGTKGSLRDGDLPEEK